MIRYPLSVYLAVPVILGVIVLIVLCTSALAQLRSFLRHSGPLCRFWWRYTASWHVPQPKLIDLSVQRRDRTIYRDAVDRDGKPHLARQIVSHAEARAQKARRQMAQHGAQVTEQMERPVRPWLVH